MNTPPDKWLTHAPLFTCFNSLIALPSTSRHRRISFSSLCVHTKTAHIAYITYIKWNNISITAQRVEVWVPMSVVGVSRTSFSFQQKKGRPHNKHFGKRVRCVGESVFKQKKIANIITYKIHHPI